MKQQFLPGFPDGAIKIGTSLSILKKDGQVTYFVGNDNYFSHREGDLQTQRLAFATLLVNSHVRACDLENEPLCMPHRTLMNWTSQLREKGPNSFFYSNRTPNPRVMTPEKIAECGQLLSEDIAISVIAKRVEVNESTLRKAIKRGVVVKALKNVWGEDNDIAPGTTKTERSRADAEAGMGTACTRADERVAAAMGLAECATGRFEHSSDVNMGAILVGLPALCANGLLSGIGKHIQLPDGFYSCLHILLTLGFMALGRIRRPEGLRHIPPGELGKVIGLDRAPEVRTMRAKITEMASSGNPGAWMQELSKFWMENEPEEAGYLYVDGHVRVYHGEKAKLPRRYVSRERLCLRGTTDYWVNDALGKPFFVVSKTVTEGLGDVLLEDIVPKLLKTVPGQPSEKELDADPLLHRFVIVFDREGATHSLFAKLWEKRIGAISYRKNVEDAWPESEFSKMEVPIPGGGNSRMMLAMREGTLATNKASISVTEVRRLTETGHQTAVIATARHLGSTIIAGRMFSRWCQENFFAYMMDHYDIDGLVQYGAEPLPDTLSVVNPAWRELDKTVRKALHDLRKLQTKLGAEKHLDDGAKLQNDAEFLQDIQTAQKDLERLRSERRKQPKKVLLESLPEHQKPTKLLPLNKQLTDTVKMIAYRAETALVAILRRHLNKEEEARALIRELFVSSADIEPNDSAGTLTIRVHRMTCPAHDTAIAMLLGELTKQNFCHPETKARMIFALV
ncbi:MAG: putative transposase [Candidatus Ozemobacteraceae bacterium]